MATYGSYYWTRASTTTPSVTTPSIVNSFINDGRNLLLPTTTSLSEDDELRRGPYWYLHMPELNIPEYWKQFPPRSNAEHEALGYAIIVLAFLALCGNGCVIYVFTCTKSLRTPSNALIVNLAVSDFLMMFTQCPIYVTNAFHHRWALPAYMCPVMAFLGAVFGIASIMSMTAIAFDRYMVICRPFLMLRSQMTRDRAKWAILFVWLYSLGWSMPPLFGYSQYVPEGFMTTCSYDYLDESFTSRAFIFGMAVGAYFLPLGIVIVCYLLIVSEVKKSERKFARKTRDITSSSSNSSGGGTANSASALKEHAKRSKEVQIAKVIFMVIVCWTVAWTPYLIVSLLGIFHWYQLLTPWTSQLPAIFAKSGSVYNPLVYAISHPKYREAARRHFPFLVCLSTNATKSSETDDDGGTAPTGSIGGGGDGTTTTRGATTTNASSARLLTVVRNTTTSGGGGGVSDVEGAGARTDYEEVELHGGSSARS